MMPYLLLLLVYLVRLVLWFAYGVLRFLAKPGSRFLVPIAAGVVLYLSRESVRLAVPPMLEGVPPGDSADPLLIDTTIVIGFILTTVAYVVSSYILAVVLGTFPTLNRPLKPHRRLRSTTTNFSPAVVRIAVPPLRRS